MFPKPGVQRKGEKCIKSVFTIHHCVNRITAVVYNNIIYMSAEVKLTFYTFKWFTPRWGLEENERERKKKEMKHIFFLELRRREDVSRDKRCHMRVSRTNFAWVFIYPWGINCLRKLALILCPRQYIYIYIDIMAFSRRR